MKILLGAHATVLGGAAFVLLDTVRALQARHEVQVVMPAAEGLLYPELVSLGVKIHILPGRHWIPFPLAPFEGDDVTALQQLLADENIGLAVSNTAVIASLALAAARRGIPHIWYIHEALATNIDVYPVIGPPRCFMTITGLSSRVLTSSRNILQEFRDYLPADLKHSRKQSSMLNVLYPALRKKFSGHETGPRKKFERFTAIHCGAQSFNKGADKLVLAADKIRKQIPSFQLLLVGMPGDASPFVRDAISRLQLEDAVAVYPHSDRLPDLVARAHLAIYPSIRESFGLSMLEAAASGIPVLATRSGGSEEVLENFPATTWLESNTEAEICEQVMELHRRYDEVDTLARRSAPEVAAQFSYERFEDELLGHVDQVMQSVPVQTVQPCFREMDLQHAGAQREIAQFILREIYRYCFEHKSGFEDCSLLVMDDSSGDYTWHFAGAGLNVQFAAKPGAEPYEAVARRFDESKKLAGRITEIRDIGDSQRLIDFVLCLYARGQERLPGVLSGLEVGTLVFICDYPGARELMECHRFSLRNRGTGIHCWEKVQNIP